MQFKSISTKSNNCYKILIINLLLIFSCSNSSASESVDRIAIEILKSHPRIEAARREHDSAVAKAQEIHRRLWRPNISISKELGQQQFSTESITSPWRDAERRSIRGTQLLYDFNGANWQVQEQQAVALQAEAVAKATEEAVLLEMLTAHWSMVRARLALDIAQRNEASVRNLTTMENSLVELGKGYESNVLQAKVQLAAAEARRIRAEGALEIAQARINALFADFTKRVQFNEVAVVRSDQLPQTLEAALEAAMQSNQQLKVGIHRSQALTHRLSNSEVREARPKLETTIEMGQRKNWDSAIDNARVNDKKALLQLRWDFNAAGASISASTAIRNDLEASQLREAEAKQLVQEQVTIAWRNMTIARQNQAILANQVRIAAKFFELATAERQFGRRSLLDVLTAEVALTTAMSDLASTEVDAAIAALTLLQSSGRLSLDKLIMRSAKDVIPGAALP